ncbi:MAG: phospholipase D-like domain-containing protein [Dokdonella sp.]
MALAVMVTFIATIVVGALALNFRTPNKVKHQVENKYAISDPQFRREMSVLLGPAIVSGNRVIALDNGEQIFPAMLDAIRAAQTSITFETFIYWSGQVGKNFCDALSERAGAGVMVCVTIDAVGGAKMDEEIFTRMRDAGVRIERYRPLRWYNVSRFNNRTHRKLLMVDGAIGFTGGVGIADQWDGSAQDPDHWRDMHFRIEGPVVAQLQAAFNDNWLKMTGELVNGAGYFPALVPSGAHDANLFKSSPEGGSESMHLMYLMVVAAAEHSIDLAAAYFVPDHIMSNALVAARKRGVRIRILMPGRHIDSAATRLASKSSWEPLLFAGVEMYQYQPTMIHNKMLIADRELVSVGSTNFDMRSFQINDEASLNVYDCDFADRMTKTFEGDLAKSERYSLDMWKTRSWTERLGEKLVLPFKSQF